MSDTFHLFLPADDPVELNGPDVTLIEVGDLLYWDAANSLVKPLTSLTTGASEVIDQEKVAKMFAGVAKSKRRVTDTPAGPMRFLPECIMDFPCVSATPKFGDYVGPTWDGGSALVDQKVAVVADREKAIGQVVKNYTAATTTVRVRFLSPIIRRSLPAEMEAYTQTAVTDTATITVAQLLTHVLDGTPVSAATYTLPTAALLVAGIPGAKVGDSFRFLVNNKGADADAITIAAGTGGTADGTLTVAQNVIREFVIIITNITAESEAYFVYGLG